jgi:hypothetical protein
MTALQTMKGEDAQLDPIDPDSPLPVIELSPTEAAAWERICDRVLKMVGNADREELPSHVGIAGREPRVRLVYHGDSAAITIPYWYDGDEARSAMSTAYLMGRIVEQETDLVGVDGQTTSGLAIENVQSAVDLYAATRAFALRSVGRQRR